MKVIYGEWKHGTPIVELGQIALRVYVPALWIGLFLYRSFSAAAQTV